MAYRPARHNNLSSRSRRKTHIEVCRARLCRLHYYAPVGVSEHSYATCADGDELVRDRSSVDCDDAITRRVISKRQGVKVIVRRRQKPAFLDLQAYHASASRVRGVVIRRKRAERNLQCRCNHAVRHSQHVRLIDTFARQGNPLPVQRYRVTICGNAIHRRAAIVVHPRIRIIPTQFRIALHG